MCLTENKLLSQEVSSYVAPCIFNLAPKGIWITNVMLPSPYTKRMNSWYISLKVSWSESCCFKSLGREQTFKISRLGSRQCHCLNISLLHILTIFHISAHKDYLNFCNKTGGTRWRSWLRHCATSRKVAGSIPDGVIGIFHWHNPSSLNIALGLTQPLT